jgi:hypothetical protein
VPDAAPPQPDGSADPAARLTRALYERQGRIQACFEEHVQQVAGTPEIALKCQLDADGAVLKVRLEPRRLESTPLGQCLLVVARETDFPAPGKALTLTLPITARVAR